MVSNPDEFTALTIDVPLGRVVRQTIGVAVDVDFKNVLPYPIKRSIHDDTGFGRDNVDVAFAGALCGSISALGLGLEFTPKYVSLREIRREAEWALNDTEFTRNSKDPCLSGIYGIVVFADFGDPSEGTHRRNVTVLAKARFDRSPGGSRTAARVARRAAEGRRGLKHVLDHDSIAGTRFIGRLGPMPTHETSGAVVAPVRRILETRRSELTLDLANAIGPGIELA